MPDRGAVESVVFYISGHGFGHASRQIEIVNAYGATDGAARIVIRTSAARWLFAKTVSVPFTFIDAPVDTGVVQIDSLRLDEAETVRRARDFYDSMVDRAQAEAAFLRDHCARLVVSDAPPLGCAAAAAAGIPSVVCSNFTWDWIYEGYDAPGELILRIQEAYRKAQSGWRLPMHGGFETFADVIDLPFVARHATWPRDDVRRALDLPLDRPLALASFGGYGVDGLDVASLDCLDSGGVVFVEAADRRPPARPGTFVADPSRLYNGGPRYEDLVAAVDVVVTKPGYGIVAECAANGTAMLYTSRGRFVEFDVLVREMPRYLRCEFLPQADLLAGRWRAALDRLLAQPAPPEKPRTDGAAVAALKIGAALRA